jgi:ribonuclease P protein component
VVRNRAKRRLREAVRAAGLPAGYDFVVIAGETVPTVPFLTLVSWIVEGAGSDRGQA